MFKESLGEFKYLRNITTAAMFAALSVIVSYFTVEIGSHLKIGFSTLINQVVYYLFGPVFGAFFGGALDILKYIARPTGEFFPGWTLGAMVGGLIYGSFFYKRRITFFRVLAAEFTASLICNVILGSTWLYMMYGYGFILIRMPDRILKNLIMLPINTVLFYSMWKSLEASGLFRMVREGKYANVRRK
ncbi:folate family ECF transporter S component [Lachnospiraceae bacterium 62-35]